MYQVPFTNELVIVAYSDDGFGETVRKSKKSQGQTVFASFTSCVSVYYSL